MCRFRFFSSIHAVASINWNAQSLFWKYCNFAIISCASFIVNFLVFVLRFFDWSASEELLLICSERNFHFFSLISGSLHLPMFWLRAVSQRNIFDQIFYARNEHKSDGQVKNVEKQMFRSTWNWHTNGSIYFINIFRGTTIQYSRYFPLWIVNFGCGIVFYFIFTLFSRVRWTNVSHFIVIHAIAFVRCVHISPPLSPIYSIFNFRQEYIFIETIKRQTWRLLILLILLKQYYTVVMWCQILREFIGSGIERTES